MTPTGSVSKSLSRAPSGLGLSQNIESAFAASENGRVTAKITPERVLDVSYLANVKLPTYNATNVKNLQTSVRADLTRAALQTLTEDSSLKSIQVLGPAQGTGSGPSGSGENEGGGGSSAGMPSSVPWIVGGVVAAGLALQLTTRSAKRKMAKAGSSGSKGRENPGEDFYEVEIEIETGEPTDPETPISIHNVLVEEWEEMTDVSLDSPSRPGRERTPKDGSIEQSYPFGSREAAEEFASMAMRYAADLTGPELGKDSPGSFSVEVEKGGEDAGRGNPDGPRVRVSIPSEIATGDMTRGQLRGLVIDTIEANGGDVVTDADKMVVGEFDDEETASAASRQVTTEASKQGVTQMTVQQMPRMNSGESETGGGSGRDNPEEDPNNTARFHVARSTVDPDEMDRANVHRTSMAADLSTLDMPDQRRVASNLAVAPGGKVTVYENASEGLKERSTFVWDPSGGFSAA